MRNLFGILSALPAGLLTAALSVGPSLAAVSKGVYVGKTKAEIVTNMKKQGYSVRKFEREGRWLEVEAMYGEVRYEIHVDPKTGKVVKVEEDD